MAVVFVTAISLQATEAGSRPNVVFILVDDLGWNDLGCYGSSFYDTPEIDAFSKTAVRFTQAYSASPVCSPARAALMTGKDPVRVDITDWIPGYEQRNAILVTPQDRDELALEETTLGEVFKQAGYRTAYIGKWHLGETAAYWPEAQGFDVNKGGFSKGSPQGGYYSPYENPRLSDGPEGEYLTDRLTDEAIEFMESSAESPFLLYLSFYTVHAPIQGSKKWDTFYENKHAGIAENLDGFAPEGLGFTRLKQGNTKYAAMVRSMDENVGRVLLRLDELGLSDKTIVVFTSDNGGLSTGPRKNSPTSVRPLRAGKGWLYEGGIRVPLIVRAPGLAKPGSESDQVTVGTDLFPTLLDLAQIESPDRDALDGISLFPALGDSSRVEPRVFAWHFPHYHASTWTPGTALRKGDWKLIERYEDRSFELYNLSNDPGEERELSQSSPSKLLELKDDLERWKVRMGAKVPVAKSNL